MKNQIYKKIINGRLLKQYGSWMYCSCCGSTVGYLCYTTYQYFYFQFQCNCGTHGSFELGEKIEPKIDQDNMLSIKNRYCCKEDHAPLFSIVHKNIKGYMYEVICKECSSHYKEEKSL